MTDPKDARIKELEAEVERLTGKLKIQSETFEEERKEVADYWIEQNRQLVKITPRATQVFER